MTSPLRLSPANVARLSPQVEQPNYDRSAQEIGIVHLGIGAFHRAHQAVYTDAALAAGDRNWAIAGVSLRSAAVRDALGPQDGLYTVTERSAQGERTRLIGTLRKVIFAPGTPDAVERLIGSPTVHVVTLTVTEKAYLMTGGVLDVDAVAATPSAIYHLLARGLHRRREQGLPGLTLVSCDNLANNGGVLREALNAWLDRVDPDLHRWFERECACPASMVDRIVPAVTAEDLDRVVAAIGVHDQGAVVTEPFSQWVIQDRFAGPRPQWEAGGAVFVPDVASYEAAKLRMLNGAHSALAYLGLRAGHAFVHQAIADPPIFAIVEQLMRQEAAASLSPAPGQLLSDYADALLGRFRNSALPHRLQQIAADGSQKIPQRWLEPLAIDARAGRRCPATLQALAAWILHVRGEGVPVIDPLAEALSSLWREKGESGIVEALFGSSGLLASSWVPDVQDRTELGRALQAFDWRAERCQTKCTGC